MSELSRRLLTWYRQHGRTNMPWRGHPNPYAVWVSEIMLQQTRVETVIPYFEKWMKLFPSIRALAKASERDVLNAWEGLGYYSRARNLHKAAKIVAEEYGGELPRDLKELRSLPGIGRYTLGAIASIALGMDEPTLDGNIRRVLARIFDVDAYADSPQGEERLWELAAQNLPMGRGGDYNQALMDLGATICTPKNPRCLICPLMEICESRQNGTQDQRPLLRPKKAVPQYVQAAAVIINRGRVLLAQRPDGGLLGGMWEFPNGRVASDPARELGKVVHAAYGLKVTRRESLAVIRHAYTHFKVTEHAFCCDCAAIPRKKNLKWVRLAELSDYPMGKIDRQIAHKIK